MRISKIQTTRFYRRLIISFAVLAVLTLILIIYFSFSKTIINVSLKPTAVSRELSVTVSEDTSTSAGTAPPLPGTVLTTSVSGAKNFTNPSTSEQTEGTATGKVTIYNNWNKAQPLAATTRLLSPDGILFRIKDRVDVPAGGKVENVDVYADQTGAAGDIKASKFTIPGLWPGLQDKIYAESSLAMTGGLRLARTLNTDTLTQAETVLQNELLQKAKTEISQKEEVTKLAYAKIGLSLKALTIEKKSSASVGETADSFDLNMSLKIAAVAFDENQLMNAAVADLTSSLPADQTLSKKNDNTLTYQVDELNQEKQTARLKVKIESQAVPKSTSSIFNRDNLTNLTADEIKTYFAHYAEIGAVTVKFSPFWVRKAPGLKDHIQININEQ